MMMIQWWRQRRWFNKGDNDDTIAATTTIQQQQQRRYNGGNNDDTTAATTMIQPWRHSDTDKIDKIKGKENCEILKIVISGFVVLEKRTFNLGDFCLSNLFYFFKGWICCGKKAFGWILLDPIEEKSCLCSKKKKIIFWFVDVGKRAWWILLNPIEKKSWLCY